MSWSEFEPRKEFASRVALPFLSRIDSKWFEDFFKAMGDVGVDLEEPPWILWSRFAPWASRAKGDSWFELDQALTFLRCALSPQDERSEKESLSFDFLMVNPTFETVEKPKSPESREAPILAFARNFDEVHHRALTRLEASVIDQVRESFRASRNHALAVVAGETNVHREFVDSAIEILLDDGYLLGTSNRTSAADGLRDQ